MGDFLSVCTQLSVHVLNVLLRDQNDHWIKAHGIESSRTDWYLESAEFRKFRWYCLPLAG